MIERISIKGFKSLKDVELHLGPLNLFIGTNASGKSNFFDALRVLQGIAYGYTISEIFDGKPKTASSDLWEPIRGGSGNVSFCDRNSNRSDQIDIAVDVTSPRLGVDTVTYSIAVSPEQALLLAERLQWRGGVAVYDRLTGNGSSRGSERPILQNASLDQRHSIKTRNVLQRFFQVMRDVQRLDPLPTVLREYSTAPVAQRMGERGENFAALVSRVLEDPATAEAYLAWLKQLTPAEIDQIKILRGALNEPLFAITSNDTQFPAPVLSDGTLRFAAIAAAFFQPDLPELLMIEEVENGIHPTRLRLLLELLKSQAKPPKPQVMATIHSPIILSWLEESDYSHVFFCSRDEVTGATIIKPLSEIPRLAEIARKQSLAGLFTEGWLESAS